MVVLGGAAGSYPCTGLQSRLSITLCIWAAAGLAGGDGGARAHGLVPLAPGGPPTLRPPPHTSHPTPCTLHLTPYTLHPAPYTRPESFQPFTLSPSHAHTHSFTLSLTHAHYLTHTRTLSRFLALVLSLQVAARAGRSPPTVASERDHITIFRSLICTGAHWNPVACGTNQGG